MGPAACAGAVRLHHMLSLPLSSFSIGLASFLMVLEGLWLRTGKGVYANHFR